MASGGDTPDGNRRPGGLARSGRATIVDVARAAGVSRQTVSNAVNKPDRVAPDTLARVQREVERLGYTPNAAAQQLRSHKATPTGSR